MTYLSVNWSIDEYRVTYYAGGKSSPAITLYSAGKYAGILIFNPNGSTLPSNYISTPTPPPSPGTGFMPTVTLYFHLEDFQNVIDILRNEKPISLHYPSIRETQGPYIGTSSEPIGEAEK